MTEEKKYKDLIPVIVEREGASLPEGFDSWGIKTVRFDFRTHNDYQWPFPGNVAVATNVNSRNKDACPSREGDGLCVGLSWRGMASGGNSAKLLLLVAYKSSEVLGADERAGKIRTRSVAVVRVVDGERLLREAGEGADLQGADLQGADLRYANLQDANLRCADLQGAYLRGADLQDANLRCANLQGADLRYANLQGADLQGANLRHANLRYANLQGADLRYANLWGADLQGADLQGADLQGADLRGADLRGADLQGANLRHANLQGAYIQDALNLDKTGAIL